ncbi:uncharacterized protein [Bemisia tabaci]|uniref:uncharacterized protein isoform X2 n=1 Tax=Bemisia tabaci TaxID=7038 RepID=UPI003B28712C
MSKEKETIWRRSKTSDAPNDNAVIPLRKEMKKNFSQGLPTPAPKLSAKKTSRGGKITNDFIGPESTAKNCSRGGGDSSWLHSQFSNLTPIKQTSRRRACGDQSDSEAFLSQDESSNDPVKSSHLFSSLSPEINLQRMGYSVSDTIDWDKIQLPPKSDLHKQIHFRITNCINPDVLIRIGTSEFRYHMLVLQSYSSFFDEKSTRQIELPENMVSKEAFACIYDWMLHLSQDSYHLLRRDNILGIFSAAQYLGIKELEEQCWAFISNEELFNEDTAFLLYLDARKSDNVAVMDLMVPRIQRFFLTLVSSKDWLELSIEEVCMFLSSNYISVHCEMEVFMSAVRWLMHDWTKRAAYLVKVMGCVRFGLIAPWQLVDIRRNSDSPEFIEVTKNPVVQQFVEDGLAFAIIKYWYVHESRDYYHWIDSLRLTEPSQRNWIGSDKSFSSYREFLNDLDLYRRPSSTQKKKDNLPSGDFSEEDSSVSDATSTSVNSGLLSARKRIPRKNAPVPSLAEYFAAHRNGAEFLKLKKNIEKRKLKLMGQSELKPVREVKAENSGSSSKMMKKIDVDAEEPFKKLPNASENYDARNNFKPTYSLLTAEKDIDNAAFHEISIKAESLSSVELSKNLDKQNKRLEPESYQKQTNQTTAGAMSDKIFSKISSRIPDENIRSILDGSTFSSLNFDFPRRQNYPLNFQGLKTNNSCNIPQNDVSKIQKEFERKVKAATKIQAVFRGYVARKFVKLLRLKLIATKCGSSDRKKIGTITERGKKSWMKNQVNAGESNLKATSETLPTSSQILPDAVKNNFIDLHFNHKQNDLKNKSPVMHQRSYSDEGSLFFAHQEAILVFGGIDPHRPYGIDRNTGKNAFRYVPSENTWEFITELPEPRHHHSVAFLKGRIYVVGGADPRECDPKTKFKIVSTVWSFEPVTLAWFTETPMKIARKNFGLVPMSGKLFVIGGQDKYQRILSNVERFDPQTGVWEEMAPLEVGRMGVAAAQYKDRIWVCGGMTCAKKSILSQRVDCYDTQSNMWTQCSPLRFPRCFGVLFPKGDSLYFIGGAGRQNEKETTTYSISAIDSWDDLKKEWYLETEMAIPRHGHSVCYLGSQILILGGVTTTRMCALSNVESWCPQSSVWIGGFANLPGALSGHGSVTLPPASFV